MTAKKYCSLCNDRVIVNHWARHEKSANHLKRWGRREGVYEVDRKTATDLKNIKEQIEKESKSESGILNYHYYGLDRLNKFAREKGLDSVMESRVINRTRDLTRMKLVKRLSHANDKENKKLYIFTLEKLREIAENSGIKKSSTENLTKDDVIERIFQARGLLYCNICRTSYHDIELHNASEKHCVKTGAGLDEVVTLSNTGRFKTMIYNNMVKDMLDISQFLVNNTKKVTYELRKVVMRMGSVKIYMSLECKYERDLVVRQAKQKTSMTYHTKATPLLNENELGETVDSHFKELMEKEATHQPKKGSGWSFSRVMRLIVKTADFNPISASSYIELPQWIQAKKACLNVKNKKDNFCFIYSILCALNQPKTDPQRTAHYKDRINDEIFQKFEYPMSLRDIPTFEKLTHSDKYSDYQNLAINVFEVAYSKRGEGEIRPVIISDYNIKKPRKIIDLLIITDEEKQHYVVINDLCKLVRSQLTKNRNRIYLCRRCLSHFYSEGKLDQHEKDCYTHKPCVMKMSRYGSKVHFKNHNNKFPIPYVIYADWESLLRKLDTVGNGTQTNKLNEHIPYGYSTYLVSRVDGEGKFRPHVHRARSEVELSTVVNSFIKNLHKILLDISDKYQHIMDIDITVEEEESFANSTVCHICEKEFDNNKKDRDHCHLTGSYIGAAHPECNRARRLVTKIPVFLHNMSRYDAHLFIEKLFHYEDGSLSVVANTEENYISFEKNMFRVEDKRRKTRYFKLCFIDTFRFLPSSVEKLASYLDDKQLFHVKHFIESGNYRRYLDMDEQSAFKVLRGKGVFPYEFIDDIKKMDHTDILDITDFHDSLNRCNIDEEDEEEAADDNEAEEEKRKVSLRDYNKYLHVWNNLCEKTLGSYSDLYNIQDVLLLSDIFESFRDVCLKQYELDPAHYLTAPSLAWDAMLKRTKCEIELISDPDMLLMVEKGVRGGISQVSKRYAEANNKYVDNLDPEQPPSYLMYLDACNLYGWALSQPLPYQNFKWNNVSLVDLKTWISIINQYNVNSKKGYILQVDLEYPERLHNEHKQIPFGSEHFDNKLCTTLHNKTEYVVHVRNLQQMLKHGVVLTKIHRVIQFTQTAFMESYVKFNTDMRNLSQNEFEKAFYKLMVNCVFGRTMMNLRKRQKIKLGTEQYASKLVKKPSFKRFTQFSPDFLACHLQKNKIFFNQPIQVGCSVLDISKFHMYEFFYEKLAVWDPLVELVLMDTDSYLVKMDRDPYVIIEQHLDEFDTSNYPQDHPLYSPINKNVPGKFKDELGGNFMTKVVGLRSKLYTYLYNDSKIEKPKSEIRCKGIRKNVAKETLKMKHFKDALFNDTKIYRQQTFIHSRMHRVYTEKQTKLALSSDDNKRFILDNKIDTLPWGHFEIPKGNSNDDL